MQVHLRLIWLTGQLSRDDFLLVYVHHWKLSAAFCIFPRERKEGLIKQTQSHLITSLLLSAGWHHQQTSKGLILGVNGIVNPCVWQAFRRHTSHFNVFLHRLLFSSAAGVLVVSVLGAASGSAGGLLLLPAGPLLLLLPRLRLLLLSHSGHAGGGVRLPRSLPLGYVWVVLWAHRVSGVLPGVLWDLSSRLERSSPEL